MAQHIPKYQDGSKFQERIVVGEGDNKQELILDGVTFARLVGNLPSKTKRDKKIRDEVHRIWNDIKSGKAVVSGGGVKSADPSGYDGDAVHVVLNLVSNFTTADIPKPEDPKIFDIDQHVKDYIARTYFNQDKWNADTEKYWFDVDNLGKTGKKDNPYINEKRVQRLAEYLNTITEEEWNKYGKWKGFQSHSDLAKAREKLYNYLGRTVNEDGTITYKPYSEIDQNQLTQLLRSTGLDDELWTLLSKTQPVVEEPSVPKVTIDGSDYIKSKSHGNGVWEWVDKNGRIRLGDEKGIWSDDISYGQNRFDRSGMLRWDQYFDPEANEGKGRLFTMNDTDLSDIASAEFNARRRMYDNKDFLLDPDFYGRDNEGLTQNKQYTDLTDVFGASDGERYIDVYDPNTNSYSLYSLKDNKFTELRNPIYSGNRWLHGQNYLGTNSDYSGVGTDAFINAFTQEKILDANASAKWLQNTQRRWKGNQSQMSDYLTNIFANKAYYKGLDDLYDPNNPWWLQDRGFTRLGYNGKKYGSSTALPYHGFVLNLGTNTYNFVNPYDNKGVRYQLLNTLSESAIMNRDKDYWNNPDKYWINSEDEVSLPSVVGAKITPLQPGQRTPVEEEIMRKATENLQKQAEEKAAKKAKREMKKANRKDGGTLEELVRFKYGGEIEKFQQGKSLKEKQKEKRAEGRAAISNLERQAGSTSTYAIRLRDLLDRKGDDERITAQGGTVTQADRNRFRGAGFDVLGAVLGLLPASYINPATELGFNIAGAVSGLVGTGHHIAAMKQDDDRFSWNDAWQTLKMLGMDTLSVLPYLGDTAKLAKVAKSAGMLLGGLGSASFIWNNIKDPAEREEVKTALQKISNGKVRDLDTKDLTKLAGILSMVLLGKNIIRSSAFQSRVLKKAAGQQEVSTGNRKVKVTAEKKNQDFTLDVDSGKQLFYDNPVTKKSTKAKPVYQELNPITGEKTGKTTSNPITLRTDANGRPLYAKYKLDNKGNVIKTSDVTTDATQRLAIEGKYKRTNKQGQLLDADGKVTTDPLKAMTDSPVEKHIVDVVLDESKLKSTYRGKKVNSAEQAITEQVKQQLGDDVTVDLSNVKSKTLGKTKWQSEDVKQTVTNDGWSQKLAKLFVVDPRRATNIKNESAEFFKDVIGKRQTTLGKGRKQNIVELYKELSNLSGINEVGSKNYNKLFNSLQKYKTQIPAGEKVLYVKNPQINTLGLIGENGKVNWIVRSGDKKFIKNWNTFNKSEFKADNSFDGWNVPLKFKSINKDANKLSFKAVESTYDPVRQGNYYKSINDLYFKDGGQIKELRKFQKSGKITLPQTFNDYKLYLQSLNKPYDASITEQTYLDFLNDKLDYNDPNYTLLRNQLGSLTPANQQYDKFRFDPVTINNAFNAVASNWATTDNLHTLTQMRTPLKSPMIQPNTKIIEDPLNLANYSFANSMQQTRQLADSMSDVSLNIATNLQGLSEAAKQRDNLMLQNTNAQQMANILNQKHATQQENINRADLNTANLIQTFNTKLPLIAEWRASNLDNILRFTDNLSKTQLQILEGQKMTEADKEKNLAYMTYLREVKSAGENEQLTQAAYQRYMDKVAEIEGRYKNPWMWINQYKNAGLV